LPLLRLKKRQFPKVGALGETQGENLVVLNEQRAKLPLRLTPLTCIHAGDDSDAFLAATPTTQK
jgi:hypothetical protein